MGPGVRLLLCLVFTFGGTISVRPAPTPPVNELTFVPPFGAFTDLRGRVLNVNTADYRVAVFIFLPGLGWYSKPTCDNPLTAIRADGTWTADITTGGIDQQTTMIAAYLVPRTFSIPCVTGAACLPTELDRQAVAVARVNRVDPKQRTVRFSGYDWRVKSSTDKAGPGPNFFSAATNHVWTDEQDRLHLRISNDSGRWQCAEIVSELSFGFGKYVFEVDSPLGLDPNAVLGLFTWSDDCHFSHREIDIEFSKWGNSNDSNNAQFIVQPLDKTGQLTRFQVPVTTSSTSHMIKWESNRVAFESVRGSYFVSTNQTEPIQRWAYTRPEGVPQTGGENLRINLWLFRGNPPLNGKDIEVVVKRFVFVPFSVPPPVLVPIGLLPNGEFSFRLKGESQVGYTIQSSQNLLDWFSVQFSIATNGVIEFTEAGNGAHAYRFYRAFLPP